MNKQHWKKGGLIYEPNKDLYWQRSHAAIPTSLFLGGDLMRTYFCSRDEENKAHIGFFEWSISTKKILFASKSPIISPGEYGLFDDHGAQVTSVVRHGDSVYLYYLGWNPGLKKPLFYTAIGLAISLDGGITFKKYSEAPIMQRSKYDPWMVSGGTVLKENDLWRMYYLSGQKVTFNDLGVVSYYDIKYEESKDGIHWNREGKVCLQLEEDESNISRMSIIKEDIYKAWYPFKKKEKEYRIGYAESIDGINWERKDDLVKLDPSKKGWDSKAIDKVEVMMIENKKIMLYNGNDFGLDGIGIATL